jgi:aspartyl-tRNA(Asn)/glutamyl-tRNA(Gln) amidotransferase subunit A
MQSRAMTCNPIKTGERQRRSPAYQTSISSDKTSQQAVFSKTTASLAKLADPRWKSACPVLTKARALKQAQRSDARLAVGQSRGELDGKTVVWKDIIDQAGQRTTCGSALREHVAPARNDATIVTQLEAAGAVSLARTGLSEFAFSGLGLNPYFGTPASALSRNIPLIAGGSTSGAAVVVAHGLADLGVGTDTSGSIRIPAALNGIFGFRPSAARYDKTGVHPLSKTLDTVGTLARSFEILRDTDAVLHPAPTPLKNQHSSILDLSDTLGPCWDDDVFSAYEIALRRASLAGWRIRPTRLKSVDNLGKLVAEYGPLVAIEAREHLAPYLSEDLSGQMDPMIRARLLSAPVLTDGEYASYLRRRAQLVSQARAEIGHHLLAFPTVVSLRHEIAPLERDPAAAQRLNAQLLAATMVGSLLDWPGLALPLRSADGHVDGSFLLSAAAGRDADLLAQAARLVPTITQENTQQKWRIS